MSKEPVCLSRLIFGFSLLIAVAALLLGLTARNAGACDGWGDAQQVGFVLQAPIDSTWTTASCPTISVLGLSINTIDALFGEGDNNSLHCDNLAAGQVVKVTFANDQTSGTPAQLSATSVSVPGEWVGNQGNVFVSGAIQTTPAPTASSVSILGLPITITSSTILQSSDDVTLTPTSMATLASENQLVGQFAKVTSISNAPPLIATSFFLRLLETEVMAPIDSTWTTASCPNISLLGQQMVTSSTTVFEGEGGTTLTCTDLQPNQPVKIKLLNQTGPPLNVTGVKLARFNWTEGWSDVKVLAPINTITTTGIPYTISLLGSSGVITVDISNAWIVDEDWQPIPVGQLMANQIVEVTLTSNEPAATSPQFIAGVVRSLAPASVINFDVFDHFGREVYDANNDVCAAVTFTHQVQKAKRAVTLCTTSNGNFSVANLPSGSAKVAVTRQNSSKKSMATQSISVKPKNNSNVRVVLKPVSH